jgi:RAT1-interacting protein
LNDAADEHLDALLDTIVAMEKETGKKCESDIVTWRGMMTKVCRMDPMLVDSMEKIAD